MFAGGHDAALLAINNGKVDAGAVADSYPPRMAEAGQIDPANLVTVAASEPIPSGPVVTRPDLDPELRDRFKDALLRLHTRLPPEAIKALLGSEKSRFVPAEDGDYDPLRETARILNLDLRKLE
jgi:phosphonate transport system substrate-binding protein